MRKRIRKKLANQRAAKWLMSLKWVHRLPPQKGGMFARAFANLYDGPSCFEEFDVLLPKYPEDLHD